MGPGCKAFVKPTSHFVLFSTALKIFPNSKVLNQLQGLNGCPYFTHFVYSPLDDSLPDFLPTALTPVALLVVYGLKIERDPAE